MTDLLKSMDDVAQLIVDANEAAERIMLAHYKEKARVLSLKYPRRQVVFEAGMGCVIISVSLKADANFGNAADNRYVQGGTRWYRRYYTPGDDSRDAPKGFTDGFFDDLEAGEKRLAKAGNNYERAPMIGSCEIWFQNGAEIKPQEEDA